MKPVIVVENSTNKLTNESAQTVSSVSGKKEYKMGGIFTEFGIKNRNERIYTAEGFLPAMNEFAARIQENGGIYGEFDHPDVFDISMSRASHLVESVSYVPEHNRVEGRIRITPTFHGNQVKDMIDSNCPIFVSSRAAGITEGNGNVLIKKLFTYDIVADPGFASAKMSSINESLGYKSNESANFRIYEISDESKINEFFNMNNNDEKTNEQLAQYSEFLRLELVKTQNQLNESIAKGDLDRKELEKVVSYYEELQLANEKMAKYLNHIYETVTVVISENKTLKETAETLISENKELSTKIDNNQVYTEFIENKLETQIQVSNHAFDKLDASIAYSNELKKFIESNINKTDALGEVLEKNTMYLQHLGDASDENFTEISEELKGNISYFGHLESILNKSINYTSAIVEKLNGQLVLEGKQETYPTTEEFGFTIFEGNDEECDEECDVEENAEETTTTPETVEEIVESIEVVDPIVDDEETSIENEEAPADDSLENEEVVSEPIVEPLSDETPIVDEIPADVIDVDAIVDTPVEEVEPIGEPIVDIESTEETSIADLVTDFAELATDLAELVSDELEALSDDAPALTDETPVFDAPSEDNLDTQADVEIAPEVTDDVPTDVVDVDVIVDTTPEETEDVISNEEETEEENNGFPTLNVLGESKSITESISELIEVAKKQKVTNTNECRFLHFLNKKQIEKFNTLSSADQETAKLYISERSYYSTADVLRLIEESLSITDETHEERVMRLMPSDLSDKWESLSESTKSSVIAQSALIPNLVSESQIENFWYTRTFVKETPSTKNIISEETPLFENKLSQDEFNSIMDRFKGLK